MQAELADAEKKKAEIGQQVDEAAVRMQREVGGGACMLSCRPTRGQRVIG